MIAHLRVFAGRVSLTGDWNLPWTGEVQSFGSGVNGWGATRTEFDPSKYDHRLGPFGVFIETGACLRRVAQAVSGSTHRSECEMILPGA